MFVTFRYEDFLEVHHRSSSNQPVVYYYTAGSVTGITASLLQQQSNLYRRLLNIGHIEIMSIVPSKEVILILEVIFLVLLLYSGY